MKWNQSRRQFIYRTTWGGAIGMAAPRIFGIPQSDADEPIVVMIHLAGGNDGLNTVVPSGNDHYYKARPTLAIKAGTGLRINDETALHPDLKGLKAVYDAGQLAIVEGVGYPNPNRSHFRSTEIWHTASDSDRFERHGWIGRYFDNYAAGKPASIGLCVGRQQPQAFRAALPKGVTFSDPRQLRLKKGKKKKGGNDSMMMQVRGMEEEMIASSGDSIGELSGGAPIGAPGLSAADFLQNTASEAHTSAKQIEAILGRVKERTTFPNSRFSQELKTVARLIEGDMPTQIYYLSRGGFDTHTNQAGSHAALMRDIGSALQAFQNELNASGQSKRVTVMVFSEFGRRVKQNGSGGTDHGVAGPVFVLGGQIKGGLYGSRPSLVPDDLHKGDIVHTTDFRSLYATLLEKHLHVDSKPVLLKNFPTLNFV